MTYTDFFYSSEKYQKILSLTVREILKLNIVFFWPLKLTSLSTLCIKMDSVHVFLILFQTYHL